MNKATIITSPAGAVAKYCDEYVCLSVCLSVREDISGTTRAIFTTLLCMLLMTVAPSNSGRLTIGRIAYRREGGDGSAQRWRSEIYDCLATTVVVVAVNVKSNLHKLERPRRVIHKASGVELLCECLLEAGMARLVKDDAREQVVDE